MPMWPDFSWIQQFLTLLTNIFPPDVLVKGLQRGVLLAGVLFVFCLAFNLIFNPPGSWNWYRRLSMQKMRDNMMIAPQVARNEGEVRALQLRLDGLEKLFNQKHGVRIATTMQEQCPPIALLPAG